MLQRLTTTTTTTITTTTTTTIKTTSITATNMMTNASATSTSTTANPTTKKLHLFSSYNMLFTLLGMLYKLSHLLLKQPYEVGTIISSILKITIFKRI